MPKLKTQPKTSKTPLWWERLSLQEQIDYLAEHPRSKLQPNTNPPAELPKDVVKTLDHKAPEIVADLTQAIDKAEKTWPDTVKAMSKEELESLAKQIKEALGEGDDEPTHKKTWYDRDGDGKTDQNIKRIATGLAIAAKIGLLAVGAGALLAVNPSYVFLLPFFARDIWSKIPDGTVGTAMVLYMGHRMMKKMRQGLEEVKTDTKKLKQAVIEAQPTTVARAQAQETSNYSHYTDIIKALNSIEQQKVKLYAEHLDYQTHPLNKLAASLYLLYKVESTLPSLFNLYMTCTSQGHMQLKPRFQANIADYKAIRQKLKDDIKSLSALVNPAGMEEFGNKLHASLKARFPKVAITRSRSAIFDAAGKSNLQVVHCFEFETRRGNVTLYVHSNKLCYSIERSRDYTPTVLTEGSVVSLLKELSTHLHEVL